MLATAAQRLLEDDLARAPFRMGVADGKWRLEQPLSEATWPHVFTYVTAAARPGAPSELLVRWDVAGYGDHLLTGAFWDVATGTYLAPHAWPKGRPGSPVAAVFKIEGWAAPGRGFYHPYDRQAVVGHHEWPSQNPQCVWTKDKSLTDFLSLVYRWLNCEDYLGC
jgi:hypothetical protein